MRVFLILALLTVLCAAAVDMKKYKRALKNDSRLRKLYIEKFGAADLTSEKLTNFKEALQFVVNQNENPNIGWESDVNFFAPRSQEERNDILLKPDTSTGYDVSGLTFPLGSNAEDEVDWVSAGYISEVQDQTVDCRACWAFAALAALEGRYQILTNKSVEFSEQELIDCVYWVEDRAQDGCYGGHFADVFKFLAKFGHLASESSAPYSSSVGSCSYGAVENALTDAHLDGSKSYSLVSYDDQTLIDTLLDGPIATAVQTTQAFLFYSSGVLRDDTCTSLIPNHAVALVGYNANSFRVKNSWGTNWGDGGYMKVARGHHGCGMIFYGVIPNLVEGAPTTKDITKPPKCNDTWGASFCSNYLDYCQYYMAYCKKSCSEKLGIACE